MSLLHFWILFLIRKYFIRDDMPIKNIICNGNLKSDFYIKANVKAMEDAADFNGVIIQATYADPATMRSFLLNHISLPYAIPYELLTPSEQTIASTQFRKFKSNFLRINPADPGKTFLFDIAHKHAFVHNLRMSAKLAKRAGLSGLFLDNEAYYGSTFWRYTSLLVEHPGSGSFDDYRAKYYEVGLEVGKTFTEEFPTIKLILAISFEQLRGVTEDKLPYNKYSLLPSFLNGLYDGMGDYAQIINSLEDGYANKVMGDLDYDLKIQVLPAVPYLTSQRYTAMHVQGMSAWCDYPGKGFNFEDVSKNFFSPQGFESIMDLNLSKVNWVISYSEQLNWQAPVIGVNAPPSPYLEALNRVAKKYGVV